MCGVKGMHACTMDGTCAPRLHFVLATIQTAIVPTYYLLALCTVTCPEVCVLRDRLRSVCVLKGEDVCVLVFLVLSTRYGRRCSLFAWL